MATCAPGERAKGKKTKLADEIIRPEVGLRRRIGELHASIARLNEIADQATAAESYTPAVNAVSRVVSLQADIRRCETALAVIGEPDGILKLEAMLHQALEDGATTAAASLTEQIQARRKAEEAERKAAEEAEREAADPNAAMRQLTEALRSLPPDQAVALRESLGWI